MDLIIGLLYIWASFNAFMNSARFIAPPFLFISLSYSLSILGLIVILIFFLLILEASKIFYFSSLRFISSSGRLRESNPKTDVILTELFSEVSIAIYKV